MQEKITIGRSGAITIPSSLREAFAFEENDELIIEKTEEGLLLRPAMRISVEMYTEERIAEFFSDEDVLKEKLEGNP